ncbi:MAG: Xaa-Pro peptidase family protein [Acidobacteriota bacterium]
MGDREPVLLVDSRYAEQASAETSGCQVQAVRNQILGDDLRDLVRSARRLGFEAEHLSFHQARTLRDLLGTAVRLKPLRGLVETQRLVKHPLEIAALRAALTAARRAWGSLHADFPWGEAENRVAARLDYLCRLEGASGPAFETIVLSGSRSSLPHGRPGSQPAIPGQVLLIDFGLRLNGYCSDTTRTLTPPDSEAERVAEVVSAAQQAAIQAVRPGADVREVDDAARQVISRAGYGDHFGHGTGHGIGLEIHEGPRISPTGSGHLAPGMVFTIEPGIYLPGRFGVRIEDIVAVTETGCERLVEW